MPTRRPTPQERTWLRYFAAGGRERPTGMGAVKVTNFVSRGWIIRIERDEPFGPELYRLTPLGVSTQEAAGAD